MPGGGAEVYAPRTRPDTPRRSSALLVETATSAGALPSPHPWLSCAGAAAQASSHAVTASLGFCFLHLVSYFTDKLKALAFIPWGPDPVRTVGPLSAPSRLSSLRRAAVRLQSARSLLFRAPLWQSHLPSSLFSPPPFRPLPPPHPPCGLARVSPVSKQNRYPALNPLSSSAECLGSPFCTGESLTKHSTPAGFQRPSPPSLQPCVCPQTRAEPPWQRPLGPGPGAGLSDRLSGVFGLLVSVQHLTLTSFLPSPPSHFVSKFLVALPALGHRFLPGLSPNAGVPALVCTLLAPPLQTQPPFGLQLCANGPGHPCRPSL